MGRYSAKTQAIFNRGHPTTVVTRTLAVIGKLITTADLILPENTFSPSFLSLYAYPSLLTDQLFCSTIVHLYREG